MKKSTKARWITDRINSHMGKSLVFNYEGAPGNHVLAQVWPADEKGNWFVSLLGAEATHTMPSCRQAQASARRELLSLCEKLGAPKT